MSIHAGELVTGSGYETAPAELAGAWVWVGPPVTRTQFRKLPFHRMLFPTLNGPVLVFSERHAARANVLAAKLDDLRVRYRKAFTPERRRLLAEEARRQYLRRVSLACGYAWPGPTAAGCWFLFDGEDDPYGH